MNPLASVGLEMLSSVLPELVRIDAVSMLTSFGNVSESNRRPVLPSTRALRRNGYNGNNTYAQSVKRVTAISEQIADVLPQYIRLIVKGHACRIGT